MTTQTEALKMALEGAANYIDVLGGDGKKYRQLLAQQSNEQVEPVAWRLSNSEFDYQITCYIKEQSEMYIKDGWKLIDVLYTHPPVPTAQPKQEPEQEPVGWTRKVFSYDREFRESQPQPLSPEWQPCFTIPPKCKPLTEEQIIEATEHIDTDRTGYFVHITRAIEAAHGIKE